VELARLGPGPGVWLRRRDEAAREPLPPRRDAAACRLRLEPGDALLFCTRGLAEPGASVAQEILSGLPQQPDAPLQAWLETVVKAWRGRTSAPGRRAADLTAVVLQMGGGAAAEEAAA
jgi:hypothetical protein